jgi:hypothetical protein
LAWTDFYFPTTCRMQFYWNF